MVISVASGKGGTGKTLVATSLALSLPERVRFLDCDVEEPNAHIFLKPTFTSREPVYIPVPRVDEARCTHCGRCAEVCAYHAIAVLQDKVLLFPELCHGCGACSYLCPEKAISEVGREIGVVEIGRCGEIELIQGKLSVGEPLAVPVTRKVKEHLDGDGVNIIDVPPGTSCPVVEAIEGSDFCLLVTEPTPFGLSDLTLAVEVVRKLKIPCGVVVNRAGIGDSGVPEYCVQEGLPLLLEIPLDIKIAHLYSQGIPLVEGMPSWREKFLNLFQEVKRRLAG
ncbi:MAG: (4Fe-4S)-binding protein [Chloroflexi bacterium]|nr:MAG: (4Fe-4S)-binding protein [Chloroflexota bacterium]